MLKNLHTKAIQLEITNNNFNILIFQKINKTISNHQSLKKEKEKLK